MTIVTDVLRIQPTTDTETGHDDDDRDNAVSQQAELARLLAQAYIAAPLFP